MRLGALLGAAVFVSVAAIAQAVAPLEPPSTTFLPLPVPSPETKGKTERRFWGMQVRSSGDDVPFPEREPGVLVAARDVDPATARVKSIAIVVRNAKASGWLGGPGSTVKVETLRDRAVADARRLLDDPKARESDDVGEAGSLAEAAAQLDDSAQKGGARRTVAVVPLGSRWHALDRALAYSLVESLVKAKAADVLDPEATEESLIGFGVDPALISTDEPALTEWAQLLGVDAVAGVRALSVRAVTAADEGPDLLSAEVLWSRADGTLDRTVTQIRVPHRTYPARGRLKVVLTQAEDLTEEMIPRLPPPGTAKERDLEAARIVADATVRQTAAGRAETASDVESSREVRDPEGRVVAAVGSSVRGSGEDVSVAAPEGRENLGNEREIPLPGTGRPGALEDTDGPRITGARGSGKARGLVVGSRSGATGESLDLPAHDERDILAATRDVRGGRASGNGTLEDPELSLPGSRIGADGRVVGGTDARSGATTEELALDGPGDRDGTEGRDAVAALQPRGAAEPQGSQGEADFCALAPKARGLGTNAWRVHHPLNEAMIVSDGDPMLVAIARELAHDRGARVRISGFTCSVGEGTYNFSLGSRRADSTRERLIELGVPAARIDSTSEGEENPACTNETRIGRMNNRRTEIRIQPGSDRSEDR